MSELLSNMELKNGDTLRYLTNRTKYFHNVFLALGYTNYLN